jgi:hypothetical protein
MRRAFAISLLTAICFWLIAPIAFADPQSNLPACCRRNGAHHCAMAAGGAASTPDASLRSIGPRCPAFPIAITAPAGVIVAFLKDSTTIFAGLAGRLSIQFQTEAPSRIAFNRSHQKRGPPVFLS